MSDTTDPYHPRVRALVRDSPEYLAEQLRRARDGDHVHPSTMKSLSRLDLVTRRGLTPMGRMVLRDVRSILARRRLAEESADA